MNLYYHLYQTGDWQRIFTNQIHLMQISGLLEVVDVMKLAVICPAYDQLDQVKKLLPPKASIDYATVRNEYEYNALRILWEDCQNLWDDTAVVYLHSKGVIHPSDAYTATLNDAVITRWLECVAALKQGYNCAGPSLRSHPSLHFSGNFWWAKPRYIKKLQPPILTENRFAYEQWIGSSSAFSPFEIK